MTVAHNTFSELAYVDKGKSSHRGSTKEVECRELVTIAGLTQRLHFRSEILPKDPDFKLMNYSSNQDQCL